MRTVIERNGKTAVIEFPASESVLQEKEMSLGVYDPTDTVFRIVKTDPEYPELKVLEGQYADADHLNLLMRIEDGMFGDEEEKFRAVLCARGTSSLKDMINISQNLGHWTLVRPDMSRRDAGFGHYMDIHGSISSEEISVTDFEAIAEELTGRKDGMETPWGTLYENDTESTEFFDGVHMPEYRDDPDALVSVSLTDGKDSEFLQLPCESSAIAKALKRLGTGEDYTVEYRSEIDLPEKIAGLITGISRCDIYDLDHLLETLQGADREELGEFLMAVRYCDEIKGGDTAAYYGAIADNTDKFVYVPEADCEYGYGEWLIQYSGRYTCDSGLYDYYDYGALGRDTALEERGLFLSCGYVGISPEYSIEDILGEENGMEMTQ